MTFMAVDLEEFDEDSGGNKIGCPSCGEELFDASKDWQKDGYVCKECGYIGFGV